MILNKLSIEILQKLDAKDACYQSGYVLRSMNTQPLSFARETYNRTLNKNLGDPNLFPGTSELETIIGLEISQALSFSTSSPFCNFVSGGSEANTLAIWAARNYFRKSNHKHPGSIILPSTAHISLFKAADLLSLKPLIVDVDNEFRSITSSIKSMIQEDTVAIVGIAGTTGAGLADPLNQLCEIAQETDIWLHIDGALGGFVYPFIEGSTHRLLHILDAANSITTDPHKMLAIPIPTGSIFYSDSSLLESITFPVIYLGKEVNSTTITGTRSGAGMWALAEILATNGWEFYQNQVILCHENAKYFQSELRKREIDSQIDVETVIVLFTLGNKSLNERFVLDALQEGWHLGLYKDLIRLVIMPHVDRSHIDDFLSYFDHRR